MASTFGWTFEYIKETSMEDMFFLLEGSRKFNERQEKKLKESSANKHGSNQGRRTISNVNELRNLPGVKTIKRKR